MRTRSCLSLNSCSGLARSTLQVPIPQYPLYSATLTLYGGILVPYLLDEAKGWGLDVAHLREQLAVARSNGTSV